MRDRDAERLDRQVNRISNELPSVAGGFLRWLKDHRRAGFRFRSGYF